jgi:ATP adenylyltransferase
VLEGGRNSLLESAQEATLHSVATAAFPRQCNKIGKIRVATALSRAPRLKQKTCGRKRIHATSNYTDADGTQNMDLLWTPWRYAYITTADSTDRPGVPPRLAAWPGDHQCVFCNLMASIDYAIEKGMDREEAEAAGGLVYRGQHCLICLNAFPYISGHVMVMPYAHLDRLAKLPTVAAHELIDLAQRTEQALEKLYHPQGFNFGMNLGRAAGAGVAGHLHMHAMPRWTGDTNFMTTIAETRVLPEDLQTTWKRLRAAFAETDRV